MSNQEMPCFKTKIGKVIIEAKGGAPERESTTLICGSCGCGRTTAIYDAGELGRRCDDCGNIWEVGKTK